MKTVTQLYVSPAPTTTIKRPVKELQGFNKTYLQPGEERTVTVAIDQQHATSYWDEIKKAWVSDAGTYGLHVGQSSQQLELHGASRVRTATTQAGSLQDMSSRDMTLVYGPDGRLLQQATLSGGSAMQLAGPPGQRGRRLSAESINFTLGDDGTTVTSLTGWTISQRCAAT